MLSPAVAMAAVGGVHCQLPRAVADIERTSAAIATAGLKITAGVASKTNLLDF